MTYGARRSRLTAKNWESVETECLVCRSGALLWFVGRPMLTIALVGECRHCGAVCTVLDHEYCDGTSRRADLETASF